MWAADREESNIVPTPCRVSRRWHRMVPSLWQSRVPRLEGAWPLSCGQHTLGAPQKYPDTGQQGNDLSESQGDRIWPGAEFFPCGFLNPPTTCLNFSL